MEWCAVCARLARDKPIEDCSLSWSLAIVIMDVGNREGIWCLSRFCKVLLVFLR